MACRRRHNVIWWVSRETKQREREGNVKKLDLNKSAGILNVLTATRVMPKIVGGKPAKAGKWPWMTALTYHGCSAAECQFCGGALIAPRWV
ncbi:MAG: trypsin-like serine protease, partial [Deltaproteobacteria bacterium]|nr:trypsin-like serine protease [Deltaproteobacteria bacterium]